MTEHPDVVALHRRALERTRRVVSEVPEHGWDEPTPCSEWTVRDVTNHLASECRWVPEILAGRSVQEVGDRYEGDVLGDDPREAFAAASTAATKALADLDDLGRTVHLSFGDVPAELYAWQLFTDALIHGWDIAMGAAVTLELDPELCAPALEANRPMVTQEVRDAGIIGPEVAVPDDAPVCSRLLAFLGRDPSWSRPTP